MRDDQNTKAITDTVNDYFVGTYEGDRERVKRAFHKDAHIVGFIHAQSVDWSLADFLDRVTASPTAKDKKEKYDKKILTIDKTEDTAIVKTRVLVGPLTFTDYMMLIRLDGRWIIRSKSFTTNV